MATTEKTSLSLDRALKEYAEAHGWNLSELWNDAARRRKANDERAVGVVYTTGDRHNRMLRAIEIIKDCYTPHGMMLDCLEHRQSAQYVANHQAKILGEMWPDVEFDGRYLHIVARRELKLPAIPTDQIEEKK